MNETDWPDAGSTGVVLAGGYSRRFGEADKALACIDGEPLLGRVVARLGRLTDTVVVNCRNDQRETFETVLASTSVSVRFAEDSTADRGPLYGFREALARVDAERCLLATCDTPFLDRRVLSDLAGRLGARGEAAAVRTPDGVVQPIQAAYRTAPAESACDDLLDAGERRLSALVDRLATRTIPADEVDGNVGRSLFDVDAPRDHERAREMRREAKTGQQEPASPEREVPTQR